MPITKKYNRLQSIGQSVISLMFTDSTFIRFSCEAVEDSLSMLPAEDCDAMVAVGRLDVDMELPAFTISWGTAAAIATAPWNTLYLKKKKKKIRQILYLFV